jgi:hypothetical protein
LQIRCCLQQSRVWVRPAGSKLLPAQLDVVRRTAERWEATTTARTRIMECRPTGAAPAIGTSESAFNGEQSESFRRSRLPDALLIAPTHLPHFATQ